MEWEKCSGFESYFKELGIGKIKRGLIQTQIKGSSWTLKAVDSAKMKMKKPRKDTYSVYKLDGKTKHQVERSHWVGKVEGNKFSFTITHPDEEKKWNSTKTFEIKSDGKLYVNTYNLSTKQTMSMA